MGDTSGDMNSLVREGESRQGLESGLSLSVSSQECHRAISVPYSIPGIADERSVGRSVTGGRCAARVRVTAAAANNSRSSLNNVPALSFFFFSIFIFIILSFVFR